MRRAILLLGVFALVLASCGGDTEENEPSGSTTPSATMPTASESSPSPSVALPSDLLGTWTGDLIEFERDEGGKHFEETVWSTTVTIQECDANERCGYATEATKKQGSTGRPARCRLDLHYLMTVSRDIIFREAVISGPCSEMSVALTPRPDGQTLSMDEDSGIARGVLRRTPTS